MIQEKNNELKKNIEQTLEFYSSNKDIQLDKFKDDVYFSLDKLLELANLSEDSPQLNTSIETTLDNF
ncbi:hypothetical protein [Leuconostoc mesenteroides]|uniref:hypothetical protein n=1 Tax=Leuconostoc mesenteroides TaxID=1245 RepID=UPI00235F533E|nr:hypothetical protein [Leuconostoc mesenteroides]